ncbi:MAG: ATP-binding protein [Deltaproteobacteria bacterium]|nr:ATP-binding protein [Deltaproteobacteria bacterium]
MQSLAATILHVRSLWSQALLARELAHGREQGYFDGEPSTEAVDPVMLRDHIVADLDPRPSETTPMGQIAARFGLTDIEEDTLWLLACCEHAPHLVRFVEHIASTGMHQLSVHHVQRIVGATSNMLDRLARFGLIEIESDPRAPVHRRKLRVTDRVLGLLRGEGGPDPMVVGLATPLTRPAHAIDVPPALVAAARTAEDVLVLLVGPESSDRDEWIVAASAAPVLRVTCARLSEDAACRTRELQAIAREARLVGARLLFSGADRLLADAIFDRVVLATTIGPVFATAIASHTSERPTIVHAVSTPDGATRRQLWQRELSNAPSEVIDACTDRYRLPTRLVADVGRSLRARGDDVEVTVAAVQELLRHRLDQRLSGFAKRVEWKQTWDDLVLPPDQFDLLIEFVARVRHRQRVIETWGFGSKVGKGIGTTALFSGPPGTGKTMIAGLLARELGLDLYQVDLSKIVSKYIGETEQRLAELFDAAEYGQAIILFDEADSLFGKRTEVRSSNDRYANLETNYLLQRLEAFEGICILTTNHETAVDVAFLRRLSVHVRIPMPDEDHREKLWRAMLPEEAEVEGEIDFADLAREFIMSGGYIKNAVVRAAYLAVAEESPILNAHFWRAARAEYEGMGKVAFHGAARRQVG